MNRNTIFIALATLLAGILAGYFLFGNRQPGDGNTVKEHSEVHTEEDHQIYTCSMHPQIRQNEPGTCPICGMDLIPLDESAQGSNPLVFQMTEDAVKLANIQTTIVGASQAASTDRLKLNGKIQADETTASSIVTHIPGRIEQLYISYTGEEIKKGQKIATIYSPDLITAQKELLEAGKIASHNPALLEATINKLKYWKIDSTTIAGILSQKEIRQYFDIYSDHGGVVKNRKVAVGDYLMTGEVLFDIQNLDKLWVLFDVYEEDLSKIKIGSRIQFTTPSLPAQTFRSSISFINPVIDPKTRVATIRAEINNQNRKLKPEMFITGELISTQTTNDRLTIPGRPYCGLANDRWCMSG
jgi:membrane fusion protein, copper/silver efflux system